MTQNSHLRSLLPIIFTISYLSYPSASLADTYQEYLSNPDAFQIRRINLKQNSDNVDDIIINAKFCGSGGCLYSIVETSNNGIKNSLFDGLALDVKPLNSFKNGYRDFSINYFSDYEGHKSTSTIQIFSFDGVKYAQTSQIKEVDEFTQLIINYQNALNKLGYNAGIADGDVGRNTERAIQRFQRDSSWPVTGFLSEEQGYYLIDLAKRNNDNLKNDNRNVQATELANTKKVTTQREWKKIQLRLNNLGYDSGKIDGKPGLSTMKAIEAFQADNNLTADGKIGPATREALFSASGRLATKSSSEEKIESLPEADKSLNPNYKFRDSGKLVINNEDFTVFKPEPYGNERPWCYVESGGTTAFNLNIIVHSSEIVKIDSLRVDENLIVKRWINDVIAPYVLNQPDCEDAAVGTLQFYDQDKFFLYPQDNEFVSSKQEGIAVWKERDRFKYSGKHPVAVERQVMSIVVDVKNGGLKMRRTHNGRNLYFFEP